MACFFRTVTVACLPISLLACHNNMKESGFQNSDVLGNWKIAVFVIPDSGSKDALKFDRAHPDQYKQALAAGRKRFAKEGGFEPSEWLINEQVKMLEASRLTLIYTGDFTMDSFDVVVPSVIPGLHLGNPVRGRWKLFKDTLILTAPPLPQYCSFLVTGTSETMLHLRLMTIFGQEAGSLGVHLARD